MRIVFKRLFCAAALSAPLLASPASAAEVISSCNRLTDLSVVASACSGWYAGNLLNNGQKGADVDAQIAALQTIGLDWDGNWSAVSSTKVEASGPGKNVFDFNGLLNGTVWIGIYQGKGGDVQGTAFYRLTASDLDAVSLNLKGASGAVVYAQESAVPEPGTWAMLLVGFGALGAIARRRTKRAVRWSFAR